MFLTLSVMNFEVTFKFYMISNQPHTEVYILVHSIFLNCCLISVSDLMSKMEVLKEIQHTRDHNCLEALTSCSDTQSSDTTFFRNNVTSYNTSVITCVTNFGGSLYYFTCKSLIRNNLEIFTNLSRVSVPAISGHASDCDVLTSLIYDCYDFAHYLRWTTAATYSFLLEVLSSVYEELILCASLTNKASISNACQKSLASSMSEFSTRHTIVVSKIRASLSRLMWLTGRGGANSSSWNLPGIIGVYLHTCLLMHSSIFMSV